MKWLFCMLLILLIIKTSFPKRARWNAVQSNRRSTKHKKLWPQAIVKYHIDHHKLQWPNIKIKFIHTAISYIENHTCIRYEPATQEEVNLFAISNVSTFVTITPTHLHNACRYFPFANGFSSDGMILAAGSCSQMNVVKLLTRAAGLSLEHTRPDRDTYIEIIWDNIFPKLKDFFNIEPPDDYIDTGLPYDFYGINHVPVYTYSRNGKPVIQPQKSFDNVAVIGQSYRLSVLDVAKLNTMYGCELSSEIKNSVDEIVETLEADDTELFVELEESLTIEGIVPDFPRLIKQ